MEIPFAFRVDLPKVTIGTGLPSGAKLPLIGSIDTSLEGYASLLHEVVGNLKIRREAAGNYPVITGTCYDLTFNRALMAGANFRFAGVDVKDFEKRIFGENVAHEKIDAGKGCSE